MEVLWRLGEIESKMFWLMEVMVGIIIMVSINFVISMLGLKGFVLKIGN